MMVKSFAGIIILFILPALAGCNLSITQDMPIDQPEPEAPRPQLIAGPYFSSVSPAAVTVCFVTNLPTRSGVRLVGFGLNQVRRMSLPRRFHAIEFKGLLPGRAYRCDLLLDGHTALSVPLRTFPEKGKDATVVFLAGGARDPGALTMALAEAKALHPDAIVLTGAQTGSSGSEAGWIKSFLTSNNKALRGINLLRAPDLAGAAKNTARKFFPAASLGHSYAVTIGNLRLVMIAASEMDYAARPRLLSWLRQTLAATDVRYQVVVLPRPILLSGSNGIAIKLLYDLAPIFEEQGVDAVISTGAPFYHRSLPVGSGMAAVNYLALPGVAGGITPQAASDYTAAQNASGALLSLRAESGRLAGRALGVNRSFSDRFALAGGKTGSPAEKNILDREHILSAAWARASQLRELKAVARQACRAVANPANPAPQRFLITNPSPRRFQGKLSWLDANSAFSITPRQIKFDLEPGGAIASVFTFRPGGVPKRMPVLTVECDELEAPGPAGKAPQPRQPLMVSQPLLLTRERRLSLPRTEAPIVVNGRPDEAFWKKAVDVGAFTPMDGEPGKGGSVMAKLIAGPQGLRARLRCTFPEKHVPPTTITRHDGQVWRDESVEIFIDPHGLGREFYQFSVNTAGITLEANSRHGVAWNAEWKQAVELRDNRYNVEIVIPYEALGLAQRPAPGARWGINLTRNDHSTAPPRVLQAAPTHGSNARSGCYLKVTFE